MIPVEDVAEKDRFSEAVRVKTDEANATFAAIADLVSILFTKSNANLQGYAAIMEELTLTLQKMQADVEVELLAQNSNIRRPGKRPMDALTFASNDSHPEDGQVYMRRSKYLKK